MRSPVVTLSPAKQQLAEWTAERRVRNVVERGMRPVNGEPMDRDSLMRHHLRGARGELAAKLWLDPIDWNTLDMNETDLGGIIDVKAVERPTDRLLINKDRARAGWAYLLARGHDHPTWTMAGWIDGGSAMREPQWIETPSWGACIVVPNAALAPVRELWDYVERWLPADRLAKERAS